MYQCYDMDIADASIPASAEELLLQTPEFLQILLFQCLHKNRYLTGFVCGILLPKIDLTKVYFRF